MFHTLMSLFFLSVVADPGVLRGVIVHSFWHKGFAFLRDLATRREFFLHKSGVIGERPQVGDTVEYIPGVFDGKPTALQVRLVKSAFSSLSKKDGE